MIIWYAVKQKELLWQGFWSILEQAYANWTNSSFNVSAMTDSCERILWTIED